jgi:hypothetical protein
MLLQKTFGQYHHVTVCGNIVAHAGVLPHAITLQWRTKIHLVCFPFSICAGRALCESLMWCYFRRLLGRASTVAF